MRRAVAIVTVVLSSLTVAMAGHSDTASAGPCFKWRHIALNHFSLAQWRYPMRGIMWRESRCQAGAYNSSSGATGLMQIMPFWADDCGGWPDLLFRPRFNIRCARHVYDVQGWDAWSTYR